MSSALKISPRESMDTTPDATPALDHAATEQALSIIGEHLSKVGLDIAVSSDVVQAIAEVATRDVEQFSSFIEQLADLRATTSEISNNISEASTVSNEALSEIQGSQVTVNSAGEEISRLISAVEASETRLSELNLALENVGNITNVINGIAKQTNLLALNATIEAARAGEAGKGFSVVANEVKALASSTSQATTQIEETLDEIKRGFDLLNSTSQETAKTAMNVQECSSTFSEILDKVSSAIETIDRTTGIIDQQMGVVNDACDEFKIVSDSVSSNLEDSSNKLCDVSGTMRKVADEADKLVLISVTSGTNKEEAKIIHKAKDAAAKVSQMFENAIKSGVLTQQDIFDRDHEELPGTNPPQFIAKFTRFCDENVSPLIEEIVGSDERIAWCAAIDDTAYIPTNIKAVSLQQGDDPVWNMANCRNHRYFNDRTGSNAAVNKEPYLLQTYQRDMGGGNFVPMKDISSPVYVNGKHWGGFRVGYKP